MRSFFFVLCTFLLVSVASCNVWWITPGGGLWDDPSNWSPTPPNMTTLNIDLTALSPGSEIVINMQVQYPASVITMCDGTLLINHTLHEAPNIFDGFLTNNNSCEPKLKSIWRNETKGVLIFTNSAGLFPITASVTLEKILALFLQQTTEISGTLKIRNEAQLYGVEFYVPPSGVLDLEFKSLVLSPLISTHIDWSAKTCNASRIEGTIIYKKDPDFENMEGFWEYVTLSVNCTYPLEVTGIQTGGRIVSNRYPYFKYLPSSLIPIQFPQDTCVPLNPLYSCLAANASCNKHCKPQFANVFSFYGECTEICPAGMGCFNERCTNDSTGADCERDDDCAPDIYFTDDIATYRPHCFKCETGKCVKQDPCLNNTHAYDACGNTTDCFGDLECVGGFCSAKGVNASCTENYECAKNLTCNKDNWQCEPYLPPGANCSTYGVCGEPNTVTSSYVCGYGDVCVLALSKSIGSPCEKLEECSFGLKCYNNTCTSNTLGALCTYDDDCTSPFQYCFCDRKTGEARCQYNLQMDAEDLYMDPSGLSDLETCVKANDCQDSIDCIQANCAEQGDCAVLNTFLDVEMLEYQPWISSPCNETYKNMWDARYPACKSASSSSSSVSSSSSSGSGSTSSSGSGSGSSSSSRSESSSSSSLPSSGSSSSSGSGSGSGSTSSSNSTGCFVATAAYGSPMENDVMSLRLFRDTILINSLFGRLFVRAYYTVGPYIADYIRESETKKAFV